VRLPLRLTVPSSLLPFAEKRGDTFFKSHCIISALSTNSCCYSCDQRKCHIPLFLKRQAANNNIASLSEHFAILHCSCSTGCSVSESRENAHFIAYKTVEQSVDSAE
jgi:hypothetical protein